MKTTVRILSIILIVLSVLLIFSVPVLGVLFLLFGILLFVSAGKITPKKANQKDKTYIETVPAASAVPSNPPPATDGGLKSHATKRTSEVHKVAGVTYHKDEIMELAHENADYDLTKREIIDAGMEDERIYQYDFTAGKVELIDDPENEHDPNAIKVMIDGHHVGYIKKGSTGRIRNLWKDERINNIDAEIVGGKYKIVTSYEDDDGRERYELERDSHEIGIKLTLYLNPEE